MPSKQQSNALIAQRIKDVRKKLKLKQIPFAEKVGFDQTTISKWEGGKARPTPEAFVRLAEISEGIDKLFFLENAGLPPEYLEGSPMIPEVKDATARVIARAFNEQNPEAVWVPLYRDSIAAGEPRVVEDDIEDWIPFSKRMSPYGCKLRAVRVSGDSMAPIINDGYVVIIDVAQQDPRRLVGKMIAARENSGVTIKWLRKDNDSYLLVPQHMSPRIPVRIMRPDGNWGIVGAVVKWIGYPQSGK